MEGTPPEVPRHPSARVTLVGAGPGDPELISLRGVEALRTADVVLYDALVSKELLAYTSEGSLQVFVGKRAGNHAFPQAEINRMLVQYAQERGHVVRLKGGDPYVFGRGNEELHYVRQQGLPVEVVPGVSSALGLAEAHGIPLTAEGISDSFWVITGATKDGQMAEDVAVAARNDITAVILMGINNLGEIVETYVLEGKSDVPVAIIQNGSTAGERILFAEVGTVLTEAKRAGIGAPAVIIIGRSVSQHKSDLMAWLRSTGGITDFEG
ncbi:uroporphyrinogen-III C-methyltransferase [Parapedobacter sp. DT-150]|uniref:uroporphyrinogen-III C-methyltransferase n=1 Tax=Parapedobacter sp. DT-150 TaxID=3396162 RepID=UPI003F1D4BB8